MSETDRVDDTLSGWKEIATYLGKSERSAQRWEARLGLPIRRITTPDGGQIVSASRREIDVWLLQQSTLQELSPKESADRDEGVDDPEIAPPAAVESDVVPPPPDSWIPRGARRAALPLLTLVVGIAIGMVAAIELIPIVATPKRFEIEGQEIRALTQSGRVVWTYPLGQVSHRPPSVISARDPAEGDLDGDGISEIAVAVRYAAPNVQPGTSDAVLLFDRKGHLRWSVQPDVKIRDGGETFAGPWRLRDVIVDSGPPARVWIAYSHNTWRPGFVLEVTPDGKQSVRYVLSGWIHVLARWRTTAGNFLAAGGSDNTSSRGSLAIIDLDQPPARWPASSEPAACDGCPTGVPRLVVLFPQSEVTRALFRTFAIVARMHVVDRGLRVSTEDAGTLNSVGLISPDLRVVEFDRANAYWQTHRLLEAEGRINHSVDQCPETATLAHIRTWKPDVGWTESDVAPKERPPVKSSPDGPAISR